MRQSFDLPDIHGPDPITSACAGSLRRARYARLRSPNRRHIPGVRRHRQIPPVAATPRSSVQILRWRRPDWRAAQECENGWGLGFSPGWMRWNTILVRDQALSTRQVRESLPRRCASRSSRRGSFSPSQGRVQGRCLPDESAGLAPIAEQAFGGLACSAAVSARRARAAGGELRAGPAARVRSWFGFGGLDENVRIKSDVGIHRHQFESSSRMNRCQLSPHELKVQDWREIQ